MTFGTAFVLRTRHKQTLPATRKVRTMFFKAKKNPRKTTRQTLSTEQLEPKAMFNATAFDTQICFEDRLGSSDMDMNDVVLQVKDVALDVGPVNQAGYSCESVGTCSDGIWTNGGASTLRLAGIAGPETAPSLRSENRFVFEMPNNDSGISLHASANPHAGPEGFMKLGDIKGEFRQTLSIGGTAGPGGSTFMTDTDGRMIVHPQYNVGEDGRMIVHPQYNVGEGVLAQANQQPSLTAIRDVDIASESVTGSANPGGDDVFMPKPNRTDVWTNGSATSLAPRHAAFAMMGR